MQAGQLIRDTRKAAKLSQTEAAKVCGLSRSIFDQWERGIVSPPPATLAGVILLLGGTKEAALAAARAELEAVA